ncbi:MAG: WhiB family transcriptional regulator [Actinomycetota bacterium]|jgi:WhiB family transcriptional regulator, redox-sensing transcriptional regulator
MNLSWRQRGACRGLDPDIFYPLEDTEAGPAKDICAGCPVSELCLEFALSTREGEGIWGGTTARERRRILRQRRKTAAA